MENASKVMYIIGKVFNILGIIAFAFMLFAGIMVVSNPAEFVGPNLVASVEEAITLGTGVIIASAIGLVISIVALVLANRATKQLNSGKANNTPHIIMIVIGVLGTDLFYLLGGIFGLVATSSTNESKSE